MVEVSKFFYWVSKRVSISMVAIPMHLLNKKDEIKRSSWMKEGGGIAWITFPIVSR
jgi:hypothetical protein